MRRRRYSLVAVAAVVLACGGAAASRDAGASDDLVVAGTLVTMDDRLGVVRGGRLVIRDGRITAVLRRGAPLPAYARAFPAVTVAGFVYPGLVNAHDHLAYGALPAWPVSRPVTTSEDWREGPLAREYERHVVEPRRRLFGRGLAAEVGKWAELRGLVAGTTTTQGSFGFRVDGVERSEGFGTILARNADLANDSLWQRTLGIYDDGVLETGYLELVRDRAKRFLVHLSEGSDPRLRRHLRDLNDFDRRPGRRCGPLMARTSVVHGTPYASTEFELMAACETDLVAAVLGNLLFYGVAPDLSLAHAAGVRVSLSTDWAPVGSRNLLEELKVVAFLSAHVWRQPLRPRALVEMVTRNPAAALGLEDELGRLAPGLRGDVLAVASRERDPHVALIAARERDVALVAVGGDPLVGGVPVLRRLKPRDHEVVAACGFRKAVDVTHEGVPGGRQRLEELRARLGSPPLFACEDEAHRRAVASSRPLVSRSGRLRALRDEYRLTRTRDDAASPIRH